MLRTFADTLAERMAGKKPPAGPTPPAQPVGPIFDRTKKPPLGQPMPADPTSPVKPVDGIVPTGPPQTGGDPIRQLNPMLSLAPSAGPTTDVQPLRQTGPLEGSTGFDASGGGSPYLPEPLGSPPVSDVPPPSGEDGTTPLAPVDGTVPVGNDPTKAPPTPTGPAQQAVAGPVYPLNALPPGVTAPDFNTIAGQDVPEAKMPGYVWHHNGHGWELAPAGGGSNVAGDGGQQAPASLQDTLNAKMMELLKRSDVVGADDPAVASALAANRLSLQRGAERGRASLAAHNELTGGAGAGSGGQNAMLQNINERRAQQEGQFAANTILDETRQRRDQLQQVMALSGNLLDAKEKNQIQQELGRLNAEVNRYGISEGGRQFDAGLSEKIREYGLDDVFRKMGLDASTGAANASRGESARQFDINQAQQQAQWEAEFNRQQLLDILNAYGY